MTYFKVTLQQEVQGDAVPLPEREVSSPTSLFSSPAAAGGIRKVPE